MAAFNRFASLLFPVSESSAFCVLKVSVMDQHASCLMVHFCLAAIMWKYCEHSGATKKVLQAEVAVCTNLHHSCLQSLKKNVFNLVLINYTEWSVIPACINRVNRRLQGEQGDGQLHLPA